MNPLQAALRKKFGTPEKALEALGLPATLLAADADPADPPAPAPKRNPRMAKLSATANRVHAALQAHFAPLLAADAKPDFLPAVTGVTKKNLHSATIRSTIWARAKQCAATAGLAMDQAGPDDVAMRILDMIDSQAPAEDPMEPGAGEVIDEGAGAGGVMATEPNSAAPPPAAGAGGNGEEEPPKKPGEDEPDPEIMKNLAAKLGGDAELAKACYDICMGPAKDEVVDPAKTEVPVKTAVVEDKGKAKDEEVPMLKPAMDAAINTAVTQAKADMREEARAAAQARAFVRPWVGEVSIAFDTADDIHKAALESLGIKTKGIHPSAYRALLEAQPRAGAKKTLATDSALRGGGASDLAKRFPHGASIQTMR